MATEQDVFEAAYDEFFASETPTDDVEEEATDQVEEPEESEADEEQESEAADDADEVADDEESEEEQEDEEDQPDEDEPNVIVVESEDAIIRLPDGTEVPVKDSALRQADYTKKTQALAEQRKELEAREAEVTEAVQRVADWWNEKQSNPVEWVAEIVSGTPNATQTVAKLLKALGEQGALDPEFTEALGIKAQVNDLSRRYDDDDRVAQLESRLTEREKQEEAARKQAALVAEFQQQYANVKAKHGDFETPEAEMAFREELLVYARDNGIPNLEKAYAAYAFEHNLHGPKSQPEPAKPDPEIQRKKRAAKAVNAKAASGGKTSPKRYGADRDSVLSAATDAVEEFLSRAN